MEKSETHINRRTGAPIAATTRLTWASQVEDARNIGLTIDDEKTEEMTAMITDDGAPTDDVTQDGGQGHDRNRDQGQTSETATGMTVMATESGESAVLRPIVTGLIMISDAELTFDSELVSILS